VTALRELYPDNENLQAVSDETRIVVSEPARRAARRVAADAGVQLRDHSRRAQDELADSGRSHREPARHARS